MYERVQRDSDGRLVDWNGPFLDRDEARAEMAELADEYRGIGWSVVRVDEDSFHAYDEASGGDRWLIVQRALMTA